MDAVKSKFDYDIFYGGGDRYVVVNAGKYTREQAIEIYKNEAREIGGVDAHPFIIEESYVRHRAGVDEDGDPCVCWWLGEPKDARGSVKVWSIRRVDG